MKHRLLTSAVVIHATACVIAFTAVGPGRAGVSLTANGIANGLSSAAVETVPREDQMPFLGEESSDFQQSIETSDWPESSRVEPVEPMQVQAMDLLPERPRNVVERAIVPAQASAPAHHQAN